MLSELSSSFENLTPEQRQLLAVHIELRNTYLEQTIKLNRLRVALLVQSTPEGEMQVKEFAAKKVAPLRIKLHEHSKKLRESAVDVETLKSMLPMVLMALTSSINLPLVMNALGIEPDMIEELVANARDYIKTGME